MGSPCKCWPRALVVAVGGILIGCASVGALFVSYSDTMQPMRQQLQVGQWSEALAAIPESTAKDNNYVLDRLQQGRIAFLLGDWKTSQRNLAAAATELNWLDQQAEFRVSDGLQQAGSLLSNDQTIAYQAPDYEQTLLHHYQALNYLFLDKTQDALVELRLANQSQERALARRDEELQAAEAEVQQAGLEQSLAQAQEGLPPLPADAESLKGKIQSGYTFYLSALLYEATGNPNDAYVDYRRALEVAPNNRVLQQDLLRLTQRMGLKQEYQEYQKRFGSTADHSVKPVTDQGEVVLLYEQELIDPVQEFYLPLPIATSDGDFRTFTIALPWFGSSDYPVVAVPLSLDGAHGQTDPLVSLQGLASQSLHERLPGVLMRQILRLASKEAVRHEVAKQGGTLGNILVGLYNAVSEHADTRSWSTLPYGVSIWRNALPAGQHTVTIGSGATAQTIAVPVTKGKVTLVWVSQLGSRAVHMVKVIS